MMGTSFLRAVKFSFCFNLRRLSDIMCIWAASSWPACTAPVMAWILAPPRARLCPVDGPAWTRNQSHGQNTINWQNLLHVVPSGCGPKHYEIHALEPNVRIKLSTSHDILSSILSHFVSDKFSWLSTKASDLELSMQDEVLVSINKV